MINGETIRFMLMLNTLAVLSKGGFKPLSSLKNGNIPEDVVYYSEKESIAIPASNTVIYKAVYVAVDEDGHYVDDESIPFDKAIKTNSEYSVNVIIGAQDEPYVYVSLNHHENGFIIRDGTIEII